MRRVALISDIHGNAVALEAALTDIDRREVDEIVCLGDVAAGGPQPRESVERLRALGCAVVCGNADEWLLGALPDDGDEEGRRLRTIVEWARAQLSDGDLTYLRTFLPTVEFDLGGSCRLLCFHGSPQANTDRLLATSPEQELARLFAGATADVFAGGHTHLQLARRFGRSLLVNPGSVGLPLRAGPEAAPAPAPEPLLPHEPRADSTAGERPGHLPREDSIRDGRNMDDQHHGQPPGHATATQAAAGRDPARRASRRAEAVVRL